MSVRLNFAVSTPNTNDEPFYDRFFSLTKRVGDVRILFEVSKPDIKNIVDINAEYLDSSESPNPGFYGNFVIFGLGLHLTIYKV